MTQDSTLPPEVQEAVAQVEKEADAAVSIDATAPVKPLYQQLGPGGSLPVSDLRERLKLLSDAWVESYEDGPLRIRFDLEGRRAHVRETQGTPGKQEW